MVLANAEEGLRTAAENALIGTGSYGTLGDDTGDEIVLGRDVLNGLQLGINGPTQVTEVH